MASALQPDLDLAISHEIWRHYAILKHVVCIHGGTKPFRVSCNCGKEWTP